MKKQTTKKLTCAIAASALTISSANAALVAYFPLDGTNGEIAATIDDIIDDPTHDVTDGTANNNLATWVTDGTRGSVLNSPTGNRFLAGTQDIDLTAGNGFTWSFWAKSGADTAGVVIGTRNGTWHKLQFGEVDSSGFADFRYSSTGADNNNGASTANFSDGSWHHVAYVGDENGVAIYIDGIKRGGDTSITPTSTNVQMEIGGSTRFSEYVDVQLDDLAIWDEALTLTRIQELAAGGSVIPIPEPSSTALIGLGGLALILRRRK